eukprot:TRINITY_DN13115_c0_g1_i1.p1 TRINITY_DN13115_c0_g1~~TRINITY_DN13115_c0_g1_i1.p1  ORF type:complete len:235 (+),score=47.52 TRINITY_DN13115_c0_g1_i1:58-762(+)
MQVFIAADDGTLPGTSTPEEREKLLAMRQLFELDHYYPFIEPFTFKTRFIPVSVEQGKAWRDYNRGAKLTNEQDILLQHLRDQIDEAIKSFSEPDHKPKAFFRLSTRSPKDAVDKLPHLPSLLREELTDTYHIHNPTLVEDNDILIALKRAFFRAMSVTSAEEVMEMISRSSRAISDLKRALDNQDVSPWHMLGIVREFVDIPLEGELRGFVHNKKLNALSQYYSDCFFPRLVM